MANSFYQGHTATEYARMACDTMMKKFAAEDLPPKDRFHYHQGVFLSGVQQTWHPTGDSKYYDYFKAWVDHEILPDGSILRWSKDQPKDPDQLDDIQPGILLYELYERTGDERYKKALDYLAPLVYYFPKNKEGGFWHKYRYPYQMWLDGIYMGGPIAAEYGAKFGHPEYIDQCILQIKLMCKNTRDEATGLWYHAYDESRQVAWSDPVTGKSPEFWGRAMGWVPIGVLDELKFIPEDHPERQDVINIIMDLLKAIAKYQDPETGLWYQVVDKGGCEGNWVESSCTCLYSAAIARAVKAGYLPEEYMEIALKGYHGIIDRLRYDERGIIVDNICVGTGVGDYQHYIHRPTGENDLHGMGAFLILMTAIAEALD
ncbi:MAG: glycoside hydrolase family 88 protein [Firmicutes bacterium]|nr:glycoside hydrolase family 88 protein [Bacillota bacterium]